MEDYKREQRAWYVYDWANSAFITTVVTLFFGPYIVRLAKAAAGSDGYVRFLGLPVPPDAVWYYLISLSVLTQALMLPLLGAIADYGRHKRQILGALAYTGAAFTILMYFLKDDNYELACVLFLVANFAVGASIVIYNAFLPEIAGPKERDAVSSNGWGLGYLGGGLLLAANLLFISRSGAMGLSEDHAIRVSLTSAGLWWAIFTIIPLLGLRNRGGGKTLAPGQSYINAGLKQLAHTLRSVRSYRQTLLFLLAYLIYNDGIQTVINLAATFGQEELGLGMSTITGSILLVQFVALLGAIGFKYVAAVIGNKRAVMITLIIWSAALIYVYAGVQGAAGFYALSAVVGTVLGGSQALSRSIYSFMIPKGREAEYFSIYEISDKGSSVFGPLLFGLALQFIGSYRLAILSLIIFFMVGLVLLSRVDVRRGAREAGNQPPPIG